MHPATADELPERGCPGQPALLPEAKQAVGDAIGNAKKQQPEAAMQVEEPGNMVDNRFDRPLGQTIMDRGENAHEKLASSNGTGIESR
ncbi:hypothetical protein D9M69_600710 [compost metagenome]